LKKGFILSPGIWWGPVVDGTELPVLPIQALRAGQGADVPLLIGWNRDEGVSHTADFEVVSAADRDGFVRDAFGEKAVVPVAARYAFASAKESLTSLVTDGAFACEARRAARALTSRGVPVYLYEFTRALDDPALHPLGPTHSIELWFLFGNEEAGIGLSPRELPLSHAIMDAWGRFARAGDPAGPSLRWPRYTTAGDEIAVLDLEPSVASHVKNEACDFWDRFERPIH
jgi:para-nitrobenzyl esterase